MKKTWRKLLAAGCAVSLLATTPAMTVLADQIHEEGIVVTEAEDPGQMAESAEELQEDVIDEVADGLSEENGQYKEDIPAEIVELPINSDEEVVGAGDIVVGDGVTATVDGETGAIEFYSDGGTLWTNWADEIDIARYDIKSIKVASGTVYLPADSSGYNDNWDKQLFGGLNNLEELDLSGFDTSNVTNMNHMFANCYSLINLDLSSFNTSNVTDMDGMFAWCEMLSDLNLSSFDTSNVTDMAQMFWCCRSLKDLDLSSFDTSKVENMFGMFYECNSLTNIDLHSFNTSNVTVMNDMFDGCENLTSLDVSSLITSNVTDMGSMFAGCRSLTNLDVNGFDTSNVTDMQYMFGSCENLTSLDLSGIVTSNVTDMYGMFSYCSSLKDLNLRNFNTSNVTNMELMFCECRQLTDLDLSSFDTSNVRYNTNIFKNCKNLNRLQTPRKNNLSVSLPVVMCDESGVIYNKLPVLSKTIILTRIENGEIYVGENVTATFDEEKGAVEFYSNDGELWDNWLDISGIDKKDIKSIAVASGTVYLPEDSRNIFSVYYYTDEWWIESNLKELDLSGINTSNVGNMSYMFYQCSNLTALDLSSFDTSNVTKMSGMFCQCINLTDLDLSTFDTSNVTDMGDMFGYCKNLTSLNLSSFDTSNVVYYYDAFINCNKLDFLKTPKVNSCDIELPNLMCDGFDIEYDKLPILSESITLTRKKTIVGDGVTATFDERTGSVQFYSDGGTLWRDWLEKSGFDIKKIRSISVASGTVYLPEDSSSIFSVVYSESYYDSEYDYESVTYYYNLEELDLSGFDTSKVTNMAHMFDDCRNLTTLDLSGFDTSKVTDMSYMFEECDDLTSLDLSGFDTSKVTNMEHMFDGCEVMSSLDLHSFTTTNVTNMSHMFNCCEELEALDLCSFNTSKVTNMDRMFDYCISLNELDLSSFNTSNVTSTSWMFYYCESLTELDLSSFDTSNVSDMYGMFEGCYNLTRLRLNNFDTSNVVSFGNMFRDCSSLIELDLGSFDTSCAETMWDMFDGCESLTELDLSSFNTSNVTDMNRMFLYCSNLTKLDLSNFDTKNVTNMNYMFGYCIGLKELDLSNFDLSNVEYYENNGEYEWDEEDEWYAGDEKIFAGCDGLNLLKTPKKNSLSISLPVTMYDELGNEYTKLPTLSKSIVLTSERPTFSNDIAKCAVSISFQSCTYDGQAKKPTVTVQNDSNTLTQGSDYTVSYENNTNAGTATVKVKGIGNYKGEQSVTFTIEKASPVLTFASSCVNKTTLDAAFTNKLTKTTDGTVTFESSDTKVAAVASTSGKVTIKGEGSATITATAAEGTNYKSGSAEYELTVVDGRTDVSGLMVSLSATSYTYNGKAKKPTVTVKNGNAVLTSGTDYTVSYADNTNAGTATVKVTGKGNYKGEKSVTFTIDKADAKLAFAESAITKKTTDSAFTNTLTKMTDGTVTFNSSDTKVATVDSTSGLVTIKGAGTATITATASEGQNYKAGSAEYTLTVEDGRIDISSLTVTLSATSYTYDGKAEQPTVTVKNGDAVLTSGTDYTVSYADNTNAGTATVTVSGKGNYKGEKSVTFTINKADAKLAFADSAVTKKTTDSAFTNTLTKTTDGTVTFKSGDTKVATVDSTSGLVTIKGAGTTTITATASEGQNYKAGSAEYTLTIEAPAPTPTPTPAVTGFSDVQDPKHAYYNAIYWAANEGITKGYPDGTFGINKSCTRGEMIMFLWRYAGKPAPKTVSKSPFKDVAKSHAFYKAILWASQKGITKGYPDGTFGINRNVSRGECMMFLWRVKDKPAPKAVSASPFKDVPKSHAFYKAILWGYQKKITTGYTSGAKKGTFGINENCTRGQIVTFLYRAK